LHYGWGFPEFLNLKKMQSLKFTGRICRFLRIYKILQILSQHFILPKKTKASSQKILPFSSGDKAWFFGVRVRAPNVIFEERLNVKFSEIAVEFNFEGGLANSANPTNYSGNLPDSPDSTRFRKS
jgi:hypothetical protein